MIGTVTNRGFKAFHRKVRDTSNDSTPQDDTQAFVAPPPPEGSWYVRIPLWVQTTILILVISLTSIIILVATTASKVYHYSENLIRSRLSNLAGMTALQIERTFSTDFSFVNLYLSNPDVVDLFRRASTDSLTLDDMFSFESKLTVDSTLSALWGISYYTANMTEFYTWQRTGSTSSVPIDESRKFPSELSPLSFVDLRYPFLGLLTRSNGNALANYSFTNTDLTGYTNYGYSITQEVYNSATPLRSDGYRSMNTPIGYVTFTFLLPLYSSDNPLNVLSDKGETSAFGKYTFDIVRERDVNFNSTADLAVKQYYGELNVPPHTFKFTLPTNGTLHSIDSFPVILDAFTLTNNYTSNSITEPATSTSDYNATATDYNVTIFANQLVVKLPGGERHQLVNNEGLGPAVFTILSSNETQNATSTLPGTTTNLSTATSSSSSTSTASVQTNIPEGSGDVIGKPTYATLRTTSPMMKEATIGYSFSLVANEKWLIFIQVPRNQAFSEVSYVVDSTIYVGVGVLGVVLLIVLPLSRWQTRCVYIIYKNMRLRPLFIIDHDEDECSDDGQPNGDSENSDSPPNSKLKSEDGDDTFVSKAVSQYQPPPKDIVPQSKSWWLFHGWLPDKKLFARKKASHSSFYISNTCADSGSSSIKSKQGKPAAINSENASTPSNHSSTSNNEERYRFSVPLPLPQLNRWYTDELDELVDEFNLMVEKLNSHYHHLEDQVRLRTREAQRSGELREKANIAKSEFIAIISHELRTPLNGIMGLTAVNAEETDINNIRNGLCTIIESGRILMDLLNELLVLSKSLVGVEPAITEFSANSLLDMLSNLFITRVNSVLNANFTLGCEPASLSNVRMLGDVDHIVQICVNFMSNANKFSEKNGNASVVIHLRPLYDSFVNLKPYQGKLSDANAVLEILVTDSGSGISREQLARIFDLFVQGDNPLRKNHKGAGLGMALSKQLAEGIGGYITVFSVEDVGSTVALRVPVKVLDLQSDEIRSLNGPILEFSVPDVYSTMSLNPGEVRMIPNIIDWRREQYANTQRNTRHVRQSSVGSRMLLSKGGHTVTKFLRSQSTIIPQNSHIGSQSTSSANNSSADLSTSAPGGPGPSAGGIDAVIGMHAKTSATSLLLVSRPESQILTHELKTGSPAADDTNTDVGSPDSTKPTEDEAHTSTSPKPSEGHRPPPIHIPSHRDSKSEIYLPDNGLFSPGYSHASIEMSTAPQSPTKSSEEIKHMRILLAEDNTLNQQIMVRMLHQLGVLQVDTANDGDTVVTMVEKSIVGGFHYHVIFMDLSMPGKNGLEATQIIRGTLGYPYPIVALTGFSDSQTISACLQVNIEEVLTKPVMRTDILRILHRYANFVAPSH